MLGKAVIREPTFLRSDGLTQSPFRKMLAMTNGLPPTPQGSLVNTWHDTPVTVFGPKPPLTVVFPLAN